MNNIKFNASIVAGVVLLFIGIAFSVKVLAGEDEVAKLQARITQLQQEIESNSKEYQGIAMSIREDRARCDLASAKEAQLSKLSGANNAKRTEIEILNTLLQDKDSVVKLPKA